MEFAGGVLNWRATSVVNKRTELALHLMENIKCKYTI
jgi:hypothetical protein